MRSLFVLVLLLGAVVGLATYQTTTLGLRTHVPDAWRVAVEVSGDQPRVGEPFVVRANLPSDWIAEHGTGGKEFVFPDGTTFPVTDTRTVLALDYTPRTAGAVGLQVRDVATRAVFDFGTVTTVSARLNAPAVAAREAHLRFTGGTARRGADGWTASLTPRLYRSDRPDDLVPAVLEEDVSLELELVGEGAIEPTRVTIPARRSSSDAPIRFKAAANRPAKLRTVVVQPELGSVPRERMIDWVDGAAGLALRVLVTDDATPADGHTKTSVMVQLFRPNGPGRGTEGVLEAWSGPLPLEIGVTALPGRCTPPTASVSIPVGSSGAIVRFASAWPADEELRVSSAPLDVRPEHVRIRFAMPWTAILGAALGAAIAGVVVHILWRGKRWAFVALAVFAGLLVWALAAKEVPVFARLTGQGWTFDPIGAALIGAIGGIGCERVVAGIRKYAFGGAS